MEKFSFVISTLEYEDVTIPYINVITFLKMLN